MTRFLAFLCRVCPVCIARRRWPRSLYGRIVARIERNCPFCRAYNSFHAGKSVERT